MRIPIFEGAYTDPDGDFRMSYPQNLAPVPRKGLDSAGYLRTIEGLVLLGVTPGRERGGIAWNGTMYRAAGTKLVTQSAAGVVTVLGDIGDNGADAVFTFSFDRLAVASNGILWYWQPATGLTSVTDPDIGRVDWVEWIAGYFAVTDGTTVAVTELNDPYAVNPLKYGSAEASPDKIQRLLRINNNLVMVGALTCEFFQNVGGNLFPFQRIGNALIERGAVGPYACCLFAQTFAFVGCGINEALSVYLAAPGGTAEIATREIMTVLEEAGGATALATLKIESRVAKGMQLLYLHLPTKTYVYDFAATAAFQTPIWYILTSGEDGSLPYRCRNFVRVYDKWIAGDKLANQTGYLVNNRTTQFGARVPWQFDTTFLFNEGLGAIFHQVELTHAPGSLADKPAVIWHSYSDDGRSFSMPEPAPTTTPGDTLALAVWYSQGMMTSQRVLRFRGNNDVPDSFSRIIAHVEPLSA